ncbi:DinB family protein [Fodinibius sediminis]|uniref:DinB superfamily protein n=1 Tax=Fodinibius sediminis TaxID=1214077 RepID=A0A521BWA7_9BACT|nr:DinB family protein [Fodinibius sediminis]SMO51482.1 DinB superfamily protein [Fodinibius sediminis]
MSFLTWEDNHPAPSEYHEFYDRYISLVTAPNVIQMLIQQGQEVFTLIQQLDYEQSGYRYAEGKWSVKEVIGHLIDNERVMAARALRIARGEQQSLPGYDQDAYVEKARFDQRNLQSLSAEYDAQRNANVSLFNSFTEEQTRGMGTADGKQVSVRALVHIIAGHEQHHLSVLEEKYRLEIFAD